MAPSFGRSISFPLSPVRASRPRAAAYHARSLSLTCNSHPLLAHLYTHIAAVRSWVAAPSSPSTGLAHVDALHAALAELLLLPEAVSALRHGSAAYACLLDGFLLLADAHGAFQETLIDIRAHASEAQAALRRSDDARLASSVRSLRRAEKSFSRLAASVRTAPSKFPAPSTSSSTSDVEVSGALIEAVAAAACASAAVFSAVEAVSAAATTALASKKTVTSSFMSLVKTTSKPAASSDQDRLGMLEDVEACLAETELGSDKVFRSILRTRVALLNIQTQTCC